VPPETIDSLDDDLKPMVLRIVAQNASLLGSIRELVAQNKALLARIAELEAKLGTPPKTPDNSHTPPSRASTPSEQQAELRSTVVRHLKGQKYSFVLQNPSLAHGTQSPRP
jgi:hypothetical protein